MSYKKAVTVTQGLRAGDFTGRPPKNPPPVYVIKKQEKAFAIREARMAQEQHGPVRVIMQGGKKCYTTTLQSN